MFSFTKLIFERLVVIITYTSLVRMENH